MIGEAEARGDVEQRPGRGGAARAGEQPLAVQDHDVGARRRTGTPPARARPWRSIPPPWPRRRGCRRRRRARRRARPAAPRRRRARSAGRPRRSGRARRAGRWPRRAARRAAARPCAAAGRGSARRRPGRSRARARRGRTRGRARRPAAPGRRGRARAPRRARARRRPPGGSSRAARGTAAGGGRPPRSSCRRRPARPPWRPPCRARRRRASSAFSQLARMSCAALAHERLDDPLVDVRRLVGEAALVAQPAVVDLLVVAPEHAHHAVVAHGQLDVALRRAVRADRARALDVPRARAEAVGRRGERADGAELDDVAAERADVRVPVEGRDVGVRAALGEDQLVVLGDLLREAHAAVAEDAALAVDRDQRRELERLAEVALGLDEARGARAPAVA